MSAPAGYPRRFYAAATCAGVAFANMSVAVPLLVVARGEPASVAGEILAASTIAVALGALVAGGLGRRLGDGFRGLLLAEAVMGTGSVTLAFAPAAVAPFAGSVLVGGGLGVFWVASQLLLGRRAGTAGSEHAFLLHYAAYTLGTVAGSALTGATASALRHVGLAAGPATSAAFALGATAALGGMWLCSPLAGRPAPSADAAPRARAPRPTDGLAVQVPDLLLVAALALCLPLAPVVLARGFHLAPFAVGLVMAGVAVAKIAGTFAARAIVESRGPRPTVLLLLATGALACLLLTAAVTVSLFVGLLLVTALAATGAWPLVVAAAQARVAPGERTRMTVAWNAREYAIIAAGTACSGWLLAALGEPAVVFAMAGGLFAVAALSAGVVLRRPALVSST